MKTRVEIYCVHNLKTLIFYKYNFKISSKLKARVKFFGRQKELEAINVTLANKQGIIISGAKGIGKKTLANEYGHRVRDEQEMIVRFVKCDTKESLEKAYRNFSHLILNQKLDRQIPIGEIISRTDEKLSSSKHKFLLIFKNVAKYENIKGYILNAPSNTLKIIITTPNYDEFSQTGLENMFSHLKLSEFEIKDDEVKRSLKEFINIVCAKNLDERQMDKFINGIIIENSKIHPKTLMSKIDDLKQSESDKLDELINGITNIF